MSNQLSVEINGKAWTEDGNRAARPCKGCGDLTRGRIEKIPYCMNCGMALLLRPLRVVRSLVREVQL